MSVIFLAMAAALNLNVEKSKDIQTLIRGTHEVKGRMMQFAQTKIPIGLGCMEDDGTVVVVLTHDLLGMTVHDEWRYERSNPEYQSVLEKLGPISPGKLVAVKSWPIDADYQNKIAVQPPQLAVVSNP